MDSAAPAGNSGRDPRTSLKFAGGFAVLAAPLGIVYGYLGLEAFLGPALLVEIVGMALLARRLPRRPWVVTAATIGFCGGFAGTWLLLLAGRRYCCGVAGDALWAAGLVAMAVLPAFVVWRATGSGASSGALPTVLQRDEHGDERASARLRPLLVLSITAAAIVAAVGVLVGVGIGSSTSAPLRDEGALLQAVACLSGNGPTRCPPSAVISSAPARAAVMQQDDQTVTWYTADGRPWRTTVASEGQLLQAFQRAGFANYRIDAVAVSGGTLLSVLLPNLILFIVLAVVILGVAFAVVERLRRPTGPSLQRCSFCGVVAADAWALVHGPGAAICAACAERAAAQLRHQPPDPP